MTEPLIATCFQMLPEPGNAGDAPAVPPDWIELLPLGDIRARDGRRWRLEDARKVITTSLSRSTGNALPIDYDHGSDIPAGSTRAAGWITALEVRDGSIWGQVSWTAEGGRSVASREYRFLSPVFAHTKQGRVLHLMRAALTNDPALPQLKAVARKMTGGRAMDPIIEALGLEADTDEDGVVAAIAALRAQTAAAAPVLAAAGLSGALDEAKATAICTRLSGAPAAGAPAAGAPAAGTPDPSRYVALAAFSELSREVATLRAALQERSADELVSTARAAGKVSPAMEDWATSYARSDPEGFKAWADSQPAIVAPGRTLPAVPPAGGSPSALTAEERAICRATGVTEEAFIATKKGMSS